MARLEALGRSSREKIVWLRKFLTELGFNDTSTLVGYFVSSPRERRREIEEIVEEIKEMDRGEGGK